MTAEQCVRDIHAGAWLSQTVLRVWRFADAPWPLRDLSPHGGDEDWLLLLPPKFPLDTLEWAETGTRFGCCEVSEHRLENGWVVRIGAHA